MNEMCKPIQFLILVCAMCFTQAVIAAGSNNPAASLSDDLALEFFEEFDPGNPGLERFNVISEIVTLPANMPVPDTSGGPPVWRNPLTGMVIPQNEDGLFITPYNVRMSLYVKLESRSANTDAQLMSFSAGHQLDVPLVNPNDTFSLEVEGQVTIATLAGNKVFVLMTWLKYQEADALAETWEGGQVRVTVVDVNGTILMKRTFKSNFWGHLNVEEFRILDASGDGSDNIVVVFDKIRTVTPVAGGVRGTIPKTTVIYPLNSSNAAPLRIYRNSNVFTEKTL